MRYLSRAVVLVGVAVMAALLVSTAAAVLYTRGAVAGARYQAAHTIPRNYCQEAA